MNEENMNINEPNTEEVVNNEITPEINNEVFSENKSFENEVTTEEKQAELAPETETGVLPQEESPAAADCNKQECPMAYPTQETVAPANYNSAPYTPPYTAPAQAPFTNASQAPYAPPSAPPYSPYYSSSSPYNPANAAQLQHAPKKNRTGVKVMLTCLWILLGLFTSVTIGVCGYFAGVNSDKGDQPYTLPEIFEHKEKETEPQKPDKEEVPDNSHLYDADGHITLNEYPKDKGDSEKYNTQSAYERVSPSTVGIMCYQDKAKEKLAGQGTGIVINKDGYIATNSHVIGDSKSNTIEVILSNNKKYDAQVVGYDTRTDLAVIKIDAEGLVPAEFADSELISIGEDVIAVGNPGGIEFQNTLTRGVVSAKDRTLDLSTQVSYIQTDAAINPGNSGGPLCNLCGQVVGINSAKIASSDYEGMGFAIPSRTVKEVVDDLIKQGYVSGRVKIGVIGTAITAAQAEYNDVPQGILISEIVEGGPCDNGEVKVNDIIVSLDNTKITSFNEIYVALSNYSEGDKVTLKLYRMETKEYIETEVVLEADNGSTTQD